MESLAKRVRMKRIIVTFHKANMVQEYIDMRPHIRSSCSPGSVNNREERNFLGEVFCLTYEKEHM